jgi:hypothetical protein
MSRHILHISYVALPFYFRTHHEISDVYPYESEKADQYEVAEME